MLLLQNESDEHQYEYETVNNPYTQIILKEANVFIVYQK